MSTQLFPYSAFWPYFWRCITGNVFCFDDNCYALAFGIPAILMVISIGKFQWHSLLLTDYRMLPLRHRRGGIWNSSIEFDNWRTWLCFLCAVQLYCLELHIFTLISILCQRQTVIRSNSATRQIIKILAQKEGPQKVAYFLELSH